MRLLSLDLGLTTGWALLDEDGVVLNCGDVEQERYKEWLKGFIYEWEPDASVVEKPVIIRGPLGDQLAEIIQDTLLEALHPIHFVTPAEWKQHPIAKAKVPRKVSAHTKDAIRMGIWWLKTKA